MPCGGWGEAMRRPFSILPAMRAALAATMAGAAAAALACADTAVQQAFRAEDRAALAAAAADAEDSQRGAVLRGLATYYALQLAFDAGDASKLQGLLKDTLRMLEQRWARHAEAEVASLYALLLGQQIRLQPWSGMWHGPKADRALGVALRAAPQHPRLLLAQSVAQLYAPAAFGGDPAAALAGLQRASAALAAGHPDPFCWGRDDTDLALAAALRRQQQGAQAQALLEALLARAPEHRPARRALAALQAYPAHAR